MIVSEARNQASVHQQLFLPLNACVEAVEYGDILTL